MPKKVEKIKKIYYMDYAILLPYLILSVTGVIMSFSASSYRLMTQAEPKPWWQDGVKQAVFLLIGLFIISFIYKMRTKVYQDKRFIMTGMIVIALTLVLTRLIGKPINGAYGWLKIGPLTIQPAEFLKVMIIWYLAYIFARRQEGIVKDFREATLKPLLLVGGLIGLVLIQPDTGGAVILVLIALIMVLASGISYLYALIIGGGGIALSVIGIQLISLIPKTAYPKNFAHVFGRFASYRDPFVDIYNNGFQIANSYYAMYHGGWVGQGLGNSVQKKGFLPEAHSDFMFSIILEELGLLVGILLLLILLFLILRIIMVGIKASTSFNSLMCIGIGGMLLIQTFVNVGGITGIIPLTGVTFPFLSQGGSSLWTLSIGIGFVLNIRADELRKRYAKQDALQNNVVQLPTE